MNSTEDIVFDTFSAVPREVFYNDDKTFNWDVINKVLSTSTHATKPLFQLRDLSNPHFVKPWFLAAAIERKESIEICAEELVDWINLDNEKFKDTDLWIQHPEIISFFRDGMDRFFHAIQQDPIYEKQLINEVLRLIDNKPLGKTATTHYLALYFLFPDSIAEIDDANIGHNVRSSARCSWINHPQYEAQKDKIAPNQSKGKCFSVNAAFSSTAVIKRMHDYFHPRQINAWIEDFYNPSTTLRPGKIGYWISHESSVEADKHNTMVLRAAMQAGINLTIEHVNNLPENLMTRCHHTMVDIFNHEHAIEKWPNENTGYKAFWHSSLAGYLPFELVRYLHISGPPDHDEISEHFAHHVQGKSNPENEQKWRVWWAKARVQQGLLGKELGRECFPDLILKDPTYWNTYANDLLDISISKKLFNQGFNPIHLVISYGQRMKFDEQEQKQIITTIKQSDWMDQILIQLSLTTMVLKTQASHFLSDDVMNILGMLNWAYPTPELCKLQQTLILENKNTEQLQKDMELFFNSIGKETLFQKTRAFQLMHDIINKGFTDATPYILEGLAFCNADRHENKIQALDLAVNFSLD